VYRFPITYKQLRPSPPNHVEARGAGLSSQANLGSRREPGVDGTLKQDAAFTRKYKQMIQHLFMENNCLVKERQLGARSDPAISEAAVNQVFQSKHGVTAQITFMLACPERIFVAPNAAFRVHLVGAVEASG
jgi:hypothetical protein